MYPVMAVVALTLSVTSGQTSTTPTWLDDYKVAQAKVADSGKPMVVVMGSGPAGLQDVVRDGGSDPAMAKMLADKFVCVYVDTTTTKGRQMASEFQVNDRGVVISDKAGTSQAFSASGTLSRTDMMAALERYSNGKPVTYTETMGQNGTASGTITLAGGQMMQPGMVYQAGSPQMGTVINAGGGCGSPGMVIPAQGVMMAGPGYAAGGCGTPAPGYASGCGSGCGTPQSGCGTAQGGFGMGFGFGFGSGWSGSGYTQPAYASGCGSQPIMLASAQTTVAPAPMGYAPAPMAVAPPMGYAPAQPCPTGYGGYGGVGMGFGGGGCGQGGFGMGFGGGGCGKGGFGMGFGGGGCGKGGFGMGFGAGFGGGWGGGFGGGGCQ